MQSAELNNNLLFSKHLFCISRVHHDHHQATEVIMVATRPRPMVEATHQGREAPQDPPGPATLRSVVSSGLGL